MGAAVHIIIRSDAAMCSRVRIMGGSEYSLLAGDLVAHLLVGALGEVGRYGSVGVVSGRSLPLGVGVEIVDDLDRLDLLDIVVGKLVRRLPLALNDLTAINSEATT